MLLLLFWEILFWVEVFLKAEVLPAPVKAELLITMLFLKSSSADCPLNLMQFDPKSGAVELASR